jgi:hypothetical protein
MNSTLIGLLSVACIFGGALLGMGLQKALPDHHLGKDSHEIVKLGTSMIALLTAMVLGLLVSSAKSSFDTMNTGIVQQSARVILLDRLLAQYGAETKPIREQLRRGLAALIEQLWPRERTGVRDLTSFERANGLELIQAGLRDLAPKDPTQRQLLAQAQQVASDMTAQRWVMIEEAQTSLPLPFLIVLMCWLTMIFFSFGLFSPRNLTVLTVLFVCVCSVSAAIFLVLEMSQPLAGVIQVSKAPLLKAIEHMGR